ncbi:MAG TPA: hypothetical protein VFN38_00270 [Gemmatimonadaceae bacterium]|nr:hypothetical protein [Gemmatimonadaceae bacterium]
MRLFPRALVAASLVLAAAGCAPPQPSTAAPRADRNVLTAEQLRSQSWSNAYEAVEALRMNWLKPRGSDSFNSPSVVVVYLDNVKLGGVENLRSLQLANILSIRHYDANQANARWGVGHAAGAIQVVTLSTTGSPAIPPAADH